MEREVQLHILSTQQYVGEEPERTEFLTEGRLYMQDGAWCICYEESELTGLQGTTTTFAVTDEKITLTRTGALRSQMVFALGQEHHSLYDMGMGALMISVRPTAMTVALGEDGGFFEVVYALCVEASTAGEVSYRVSVIPK